MSHASSLKPDNGGGRRGRLTPLLGLVALLLGAVTATGTATASTADTTGGGTVAAEPRHEIAQFPVSDGGTSFGGGTVYYPTDVRGKVGAVAMSPGLGGDQTGLAWLAERLAHEGFAVININTSDPNDSAPARGDQLQAALRFLGDSRIKDKVDSSRRAVVGYSLGGGGALDVAQRNGNLKAAVGIAPYEMNDYSSVRVPTMVFTSSADTTATPEAFGGLFYQQLGGPKEYLQYAGLSHEDMQYQRLLTGNFVAAWLTKYVDGKDQAAEHTLCPAPRDNPKFDDARQNKVCG